MYKIQYSRNQPLHFLKKIEKSDAARILEKIETLKNNPTPHDVTTVEGTSGIFKLRVGRYRFMYELDILSKTIGIIKIERRSKAYKNTNEL